MNDVGIGKQDRAQSDANVLLNEILIRHAMQEDDDLLSPDEQRERQRDEEQRSHDHDGASELL